MIHNQDFDYHTYTPIIQRYFDHYASKFQLISFASGFGGALLYRILAHNEKYYWEKIFTEIESPQPNMGPLDWPDYDIGYKTQPNMRDEKGNFVPNNPLQQRLTVVHIGCFQLPGYVKRDATKFRSGRVPLEEIQEKGIKNLLRIFEGYFKKAKDKTVLIRTHDMHCQTKFPKTTTIRIWGKNSAIPNTQYNLRKEVKPVNASNVVNVNIDNLLSTDYIVFEDEYFSLCENLKINPTPIPVRGYILNYLDRRNNYSLKVTPRIK